MKKLGIIGVGAFGEFMIRYLAPFFDVLVHDSLRELDSVVAKYNVTPVDLEICAQSDIVILAVPVQAIEQVAKAIAGYVKPGALVLDVASVKVKPAEALSRTLPDHVDIVCTHPLFGPQSAGAGISNMKISVCNIRGDRHTAVIDFLRRDLQLDVMETTPDQHDKDLAYVQGLTHLIGKILLDMNLDGIRQTTKSFDLVMEGVRYLQNDSDQLFKAIERENPYVPEVHRRFFDKAQALEKMLAAPDENDLA